MLLEAFRLLGEPYHLLLIGGGDGGRSGNVTRLPYCRDNHALAGYIRAADAFVHAGTHETFGLVILEAHGLRASGGRDARRRGAGAAR